MKMFVKETHKICFNLFLMNRSGISARIKMSIPTAYFLMQIDQTYCITMGNRSQAIDTNEILTCKYYWQEVYSTYA